jgi:hypothetical protein
MAILAREGFAGVGGEAGSVCIELGLFRATDRRPCRCEDESGGRSLEEKTGFGGRAGPVGSSFLSESVAGVSM